MIEKQSFLNVFKQRAAHRRTEICVVFCCTLAAYLLNYGGTFRFGLFYFFIFLPVRLMMGSRR